MSDIGMRDIGYVGGSLPDARRMAAVDANGAGGSFGEILKQAADTGSAAAKSDAATQLSEYLSMPLGERMFYMILAGMGISKAQYDAMSPEDKAKVAAQVAQRLKDNAESQKQVAARKEDQAAAV